jgi:hypothetical protein
MAGQEPKKVWRTPELVVLVRSNPEEAVLTACKTSAKSSGFNAKKINVIGFYLPLA